MFYFGFSLGINNPAGILGLDIELPAFGTVNFGAGAGISSWGKNFYIDAKHYFHPCHKGWAVGGGVTYSSGINTFTSNQQTIYGTTEPVQLSLNPQTNLFLAAYRYWSLGERNNRIYLELGYSVPLSPKGDFTQTDGSPLSDNATQAIRMISPGGINTALGFAFH